MDNQVLSCLRRQAPFECTLRGRRIVLAVHFAQFREEDQQLIYELNFDLERCGLGTLGKVECYIFLRGNHEEASCCYSCLHSEENEGNLSWSFRVVVDLLVNTARPCTCSVRACLRRSQSSLFGASWRFVVTSWCQRSVHWFSYHLNSCCACQAGQTWTCLQLLYPVALFLRYSFPLAGDS